jgi:hypothetical protein
MCESVFRDVRTLERRRKLTLEVLVRFWIAVVIHAPASLSQALDEAYGGTGVFPHMQAARSSIFERWQKMRRAFVEELFGRFVASILPECPRSFVHGLRKQLAAFSEVWIVDGSGLDRVAKRLKAVRGVREVVLPGSVTAFYDLFRGIPRVILFHGKLLGGEAGRLREALGRVPAGTLLVADRGYSSVRLLAAVAARSLHAVVRLKRNVVAKEIERLRRFKDGGARVAESIVLLGSGKSPVRARLIEKLLPDGSVLRLATTVLDPSLLPAETVLALYRERWTIERMFQHLKVVLNLRRFYAASTGAVAMQLYAAAIVYVALRAAQARIARAHRLRPEQISPAKLFPRAAAAQFRLVEAECYFEATIAANPKLTLEKPNWSEMPICRVPLRHLLVRKRIGARAKPRYSKARTRMVSLERYERRRKPRSQAPP